MLASLFCYNNTMFIELMTITDERAVCAKCGQPIARGVLARRTALPVERGAQKKYEYEHYHLSDCKRFNPLRGPRNA